MRIDLPLLLLTGFATACAPGATPSPPGIHFTDVTSQTGVTMKVTAGVDPPTKLLEVKGNGVALIDYDRDGDLDLFVPNGATLADPEHGPGCRLYENMGGFRFRDVTRAAGLTFRRWAYGVSQGDYDLDGYEDLFVTCYGENALLHNDGNGHFTEVTREAGITGNAWSSASSFGDIDGDGDLDLYVVNYAQEDASGPAPQASFLGVRVLAGPMGLPAVEDRLYENLGNGHFRDISDRSGIHSPPPSWGLGAVILDFDGDHVADIYVGNDSQASFLFHGLGEGRFEEVGVLAGVAYNEDGAGQATMGIAIADVDGNGLPDLFTTNFMYDTNTLHLDLGELIFEDRTRAYGLQLDSRSFLSWTTGFFDFDHDGDEDLVFFNGHIYPRATCALRGWEHDQTPVLYAREKERFRRLSPEEAGAWLGERHCDRSGTFGDLDGDGDIDMVVCERNGPVRILRNDRNGGHWLIVRLDDRRPGHDHAGIGSEVVLRAGDLVQRRWILSGVGFLAAAPLCAHFGLPQGVDGADLEVIWSDGFHQRLGEVPLDTRQIVIRTGDGPPSEEE